MSQLTDEERAVLDKLVEAHNLFVKLPVQHPMHTIRNGRWVYTSFNGW